MANRDTIYNYLGYINDKEEGIPDDLAIHIEEEYDYVFDYLNQIKTFIKNVKKEDFKKFKDEEFFDHTKVYKDLEKEFYDKYRSEMTFELADKFMKECILFRLSVFERLERNSINKKDYLKLLTHKKYNNSIPRIVINSYIREALNQLDKIHKKGSKQ